MIKNLKYLLLIVLSSFIFSCGGSSENTATDKTAETEIDSFEYALPHGTSLPSEELSEADQAKLAGAKGKEAISLDLAALLSLIREDNKLLSLYSFWDFDCPSCLELNKELLKLSAETGFAGELNLSLIYLGKENEKALNTYIRENGITEAVFSIDSELIKSSYAEIYPSWQGELPALLIFNVSDDLELFYQQTLSYEELQAILQPLIL